MAISSQPVIQPATYDDHEAVGRLQFLSHTVSFAPFASERWLKSRRLDDYVARWRDTLGSSTAGTLTAVARLDGNVVGMVRVAPSDGPGPDAQLTGMHVEPVLRGGGIGTLLMLHALEFIREQDFDRVQLRVIAANDGARRFYESHGWELVEERPDGVEGVPVVIYELV